MGPSQLIDPSRVVHIWVSPRKRARTTSDLLFGNTFAIANADQVTVTEDIAEWDYGDYEGLIVSEIRKRRKQKGLDTESEWNIWRWVRERGVGNTFLDSTRLKCH